MTVDDIYSIKALFNNRFARMGYNHSMNNFIGVNDEKELCNLIMMCMITNLLGRYEYPTEYTMFTSDGEVSASFETNPNITKDDMQVILEFGNRLSKQNLYIKFI